MTTTEENYQIALTRIAENRQNQTSILNLSHLGLTHLPEEIAELTHLYTLNLHANQLQDVSILEQLTNLHILDLSRNEIYDAETIQEIVLGFQELRGVLMDLEPNNKIFQSFVQEVENIVDKYQKYGYLEYGGKEEYIEIARNSQFGKFFLSGMNEKYYWNSGFVKVVGFTVIKESLKPIIPLQIKPIPKLQNLILAQNKIGNPAFVLMFPQLKSLDLRENEIDADELRQLNQLTDLESLDISHNRLTRIKLSDFPNLTQLLIKNHSLRNISLSRFPKIKSLDLSNLRIEEIHLESFDSLVELDLDDNDISDVSNLLDLKNLKQLYLIKNRIDSEEQIQHLLSLANLNELRLYGNLIIRNVDIEFPNINPRTNCLPDFKEYFQD